MDAKTFAQLCCRLLAVFFAIEALAQIAEWGAAFASDARHSAIPVASGVRLGAAAGLWYGAGLLAGFVTDGTKRSRPLATEGVTRALILVTAALVMAGAIENFASLVPAFGHWANGGAGIEVLLAPGLLAGALRLTLGAALVLAADRLARTVKAGNTSLAGLVGEFVGAASTEGARQVADLALSLQSGVGEVAKRVVKSSLDALIATVDRHRADFSGAAAADGTVTIVFSDMEGFTAMTQRLGDQEAHEVIKDHNRIVREAVKAHRGKEVELQGDGFLLAFAQASAALRCAGAIQRDCLAYSREHADTPIRVRIGLHSGKPIKEGDRFFGITVILAARIAAQASGGETLVSQAVHEELALTGEFAFDRGRSARLKGLDGAHRMYGVSGYGGGN